MQLPVSEILRGLQKTVVENSPAILTAIGVTGTVSTAVLTARATIQAIEVIEADYYIDNSVEPAPVPGILSCYSARDRLSMVWTLYIPAVGTGFATVACILGANHISSKRSAALVTAYSLTERAFSEYKDKVVEQIGATKEQKVRDSVAQDRVNGDPLGTREIIITGKGRVMCYETYTARYFESDMETLRKAQNDVNQQIYSEMYASLNDFNRAIGLPYAGIGEDIGWNADKPLDLQYSTVFADDQSTPCISIGYKDLPFPKYASLH